MKRPLNLNAVAPKILAWIGALLILAPLLLYLLSLPALPVHLPGNLAFTLIKVSLIAGFVLLIGFGLLLVIEQVQDALFDRWYRKARVHKLQSAEGIYECQFCGSRKLHADDRICPLCGQKLT